MSKTTDLLTAEWKSRLMGDSGWTYIAKEDKPRKGRAPLKAWKALREEIEEGFLKVGYGKRDANGEFQLYMEEESIGHYFGPVSRTAKALIAALKEREHALAEDLSIASKPGPVPLPSFLARWILVGYELHRGVDAVKVDKFLYPKGEFQSWLEKNFLSSDGRKLVDSFTVARIKNRQMFKASLRNLLVDEGKCWFDSEKDAREAMLKSINEEVAEIKASIEKSQGSDWDAN